MSLKRGVFRNNVDFFNNFTLLCSMEIKIISMCFCIFLPSFRRVWFSSDDFGQSYRLSKRVTNMNLGHVKCVQDVNEVTLIGLMSFLMRFSPNKQWIACTDVFIVCTHPYTTPDHTM